MIFLSEDFNCFLSLVKDCGYIMLGASDLKNNSDSIKKKSGDADFVTVYDECVQKKLIDGILNIFPEAHFFAEEKENFIEDTEKGLCFIIDPIDGTTNFIHNLRASTISIALLVDGELCFGLIYDPYKDDLFTAFKGEGAYCNGKRITVSDRQLSDSVVAFGTTPYRKNEYSQIGFELAHKFFINCADIRRSGSAALDMAYVACGKLDAFFECILSPWDYAAGTLIVREAGGAVTDFNGEPICFSAPSSILCSNQINKNKLLALINK